MRHIRGHRVSVLFREQSGTFEKTEQDFVFYITGLMYRQHSLLLMRFSAKNNAADFDKNS
jgi:hypothetical protein